MTPPGTSLVASASLRVTAGSGRASDARATTVLPDTMIGASRDTRASSGASSGAMSPTTPVGSGTVKLKYGPATALAPPSTDGSLSAHPAYQTQRSIEASTSPSGSSTPPAASSSTNWDRRPSMISPTR